MEWGWIGNVTAWLTANNWPLVALAIALLFKHEVRGLANGVVAMTSRVTRLAGVELQAHIGQDRNLNAASEAIYDLKSIDVLDNDTSLKPIYDHFVGLIEDQPGTQQERFARAVRAWAFVARARAFDTIAQAIFETQIAALRKVAVQSSDKRGLRSFHDDYQSRARIIGIPEQEIAAFENWIGFLSGQELILRGERGRYQITNLGHAFLLHIDTDNAPKPVQL